MYQDLYDLLIGEDEREVDPSILAILDKHYGEETE